MRWRSRQSIVAFFLLASGIGLHRLLPLTFGLSVLFATLLLAFSIASFSFTGLFRFRNITVALTIIAIGFSTMALSIERTGGGGTIAGFVSPRGGSVICEGKVGSVRPRGAGQVLIVGGLECLKDGGLEPVSGLLRLKSDGERRASGDLIRFKAAIYRPRDYSNFNRRAFETYAMSKGISAVGRVYGPAWSVKVGESPSIVERPFQRWRGSVERALDRALDNSSAAQLIRALVLGDKSGLDDEMNDLRSLGVVHLLVVSGLHVGVLAGITWFAICLLGPLFSTFIGQRDLRKAAAIATVIVVWFFVALTGFGTPAVRAGLIITIYLVSVLFRRSYDIWDSLAVSAVIIVAFNPAALFSVSFQLTYSAVVGIVVVSKYFVRSKLVNLCLVSAGAALGVFPLLAYHFGMIPAAGPFVNLMISPIVTLLLVPVSLVAAIVAPVSTSAASSVFWLLKYPARLFLWATGELASRLEWSALKVEVDLPTILTLYALMLLVIYWRDLRHRVFASAAVVGLSLWSLLMTDPLAISNGELAVTFLDVGQGASVMVRLPNGTTMFVDGGGVRGSDFDLGKSVLAPLLRRSGVKKVDKIVVTHPHPDHYKGLAYIAENFGPSSCLIAGYPEGGLADDERIEWRDFFKRVRAAGVSVERVGPGRWEDGGVEFERISPPTDIPAGWSVNDASQVIKISFGNISFLITGDIESGAESYIVDNDFNVASTVLQVPHHGSATSSSAAFLDRVAPRYAVMQLGAFNKYGFPAAEVVERYREHDIKLYRTDRNGAVNFVTDGNGIKVYTSSRD